MIQTTTTAKAHAITTAVHHPIGSQILAYLDKQEGEVTEKQICTYIENPQSNTTKTIHSLKAVGLVTSRTDPDDTRSRLYLIHRKAYRHSLRAIRSFDKIYNLDVG